MSPRYRIFLSERERDEAVDRAFAAFLAAHQLRTLDGDQTGRLESKQRPESHGLLPFERALLVYAAMLIVLIVAGHLGRHLS
jgi:hypothetical protein